MPELQTRAQQMLAIAYECVSAVQPKNKDVRDNYSTISRQFSVSVRTSGLAQAVAFAAAKAGEEDGGGARAQAYRLVLDHLGTVLQRLAAVQAQPDIVARICAASGPEYLRYTRTVLDAWVYFRRFVTSLLESQPAASAAATDTPGG